MARRWGSVRRLVPAVVVALLSLIGITESGVVTAMAQSYPTLPGSAQAAARQADTRHAAARQAATGSGAAGSEATGVEPGRLRVAVVAGASGSVATDVLAPFEVFARSRSFAASVVAASQEPVLLSGGVHLMPDATFTDPGLRPDVVVVPAVTDPTGRREAPLRAWVAAQAARGAVVLGVCAGSEVLAASGCWRAVGRRRTGR